MPWVALPGTKSDYLIEEVQITTAADGRQLAQLLQQQQSLDAIAKEAANSDTRSDNFLLIGGIDYNAQLAKPEGAQMQQARDTTWSFLKGTREEIAAIGQVLPTEKTHQLVGEHALEELVKSELENATVIHIATHGYFADDIDEDLTNDSARGEALGPRQTSSTLSARNPLLQCGLTLAGCNSNVWLDANGLPLDNGQDGYLSAEEIMGMDLGRTRLVVLSACETGLGNIGSGEGVFGLQRALHISGVKSTIASGWKVDDRATALLMTEMYRQMFDENLSAADALHAAQIRVLRQFNRTTGQLEEGNSQPAPPYYWAAFSLSGAL
jgi:CHAT domain-containing protein